jgi:phosphoribosylformylglycinamidine synthase
MSQISVCVLRTAGTNCDQETAFAFQKAGARPALLHINYLIAHPGSLREYAILAIPGGFTYGDDVAAGKILANELRCKLIDGLLGFIEEGKLTIGICNGFQVLVKAGLLPGGSGLKQQASLIINDSAKFEDRWVYLKLPSKRVSQSLRKCVWTKNLPKVIYLPVAHGEGKFFTQDEGILQRMRQSGQIVFQYCDEAARLAGYPYNPNGSQDDIAGICDETGRVFGLMPHPERHLGCKQHPRWKKAGTRESGDGLQIFKNGVEYAKKHL